MRKIVSKLLKDMQAAPAGYQPASARVGFACKQMEVFGYCYEIEGKYYLQDEWLPNG